MDKNYQRRWEVRLHNKRMGEVLALTEQAACLRAIKRFTSRMMRIATASLFAAFSKATG